MKLVTTTQMRAIEKEADSKGTTYAQLMQNAGRSLAEIIHAIGQENDLHTITAIVGAGNNGGDALVALTWLAQAGWQTHAYLVNRKSAGDQLITTYLEAGGEVESFASDTGFNVLRTFLEESDLLLDGLLGTGIKLPLRQEAAHVLQGTALILAELEIQPLIIAVDCPSGVDCDTGACAEETLPADLTVTMAAVKQGLLKMPAYEYIGALEVGEIGLPEKLDAWDALRMEVADAAMVSAVLPERTPASHKGTFGTALVIAGSASYTGAALLAGEAAYRIGAGLVTMAVPEPLHPILAGHLPEATWLLLAHEKGFISDKAIHHLLNNLGRTTAILIGPGIGDKHTTKLFIDHILPNLNLPLVIDADGLRHLAGIKNWHKKITQPAVLTPHPGEMSALTGLTVEEIQENREELASKFAQAWGHVVVLKGAFTVIANPDGYSTIIPVATPALARAGTGDVLAGTIVGLRAQGLPPYQAAVAGAYIHAQAGLHAAEILGTTASVLATDVLDSIPDILAELE